ncbi:AaceriAFR062Cp [[Ashbya] aceris (nom. inval.)]|nr:AaceriAFR062Cp [[Ashbya] aceris (nom. inval.)]
MPRKALLLNSLSRGKVRTSFNKYNLFNLYKKSQIDLRTKTLYQQKWSSKQETRAYHGEHLTESRWQSTFSPRLTSVAQLDASLKGGDVAPTPILLQTYAVLEKRLEFALFRAMFASSVRQARQFILHGNVYVNGVTMKHPGYPLKAGDMFSVRPDKVLEALGARKPSLEEALTVDKRQIRMWNKYVSEARSNPREAWQAKTKQLQSMQSSHPERQVFVELINHNNRQLDKKKLAVLKSTSKESLLCKVLATAREHNGDKSISAATFRAAAYGDEELAKTILGVYKTLENSEVLKTLQDKTVEEQAKIIMNASSPELNDAMKKKLRAATSELGALMQQHDAAIRAFYDSKKGDPATLEMPYDPEWVEKLQLHPQLNIKELLEDPAAAQKAVNLPWQKGPYGRQDPSKPYFTPWKPRPFLAPFAILPHHIEVSFKSCHAIYLRDPVARPGHSEVISPFSLPVHERAYMYYLRKGQ